MLEYGRMELKKNDMTILTGSGACCKGDFCNLGTGTFIQILIKYLIVMIMMMVVEVIADFVEVDECHCCRCYGNQ